MRRLNLRQHPKLTALKVRFKAGAVGSNIELSTVIPPGRMSGPSPVRSTSLFIISPVSVFGLVLFPPKVGRYENSIENEARRLSRTWDAFEVG